MSCPSNRARRQGIPPQNVASLARRPCVHQRACQHRNVAASQNPTLACPHHNPATIQNASCASLHHKVVALQSPGCGSPAPRAGEPYPGASTIRRPATPTGLNKMRSPTKHGPIRRGVEMGDVRGVTRSDGTTSVLSHPVGVHSRRLHASPGFGPTPCGGGPNPGAATIRAIGNAQRG